MSNPSPKPWSYKKDKWEDGFVILDASDESVTEMGCGCCSPSGVGVWNEDDARVISAAPDLLEALEKAASNAEQAVFEDWINLKSPSGDCDQVHSQWIESSEYSDFLDAWANQISAIAKARGVQ